MASERLSNLENDAIILADDAKQLAVQLEEVDMYFQDKEAQILHEIGDLKQRETNLQDLRSVEQSQLSYQQSQLQSNESNLSLAKNRLQGAEHDRKEAEETERNTNLGTTAFSAIAGIAVGGPIGSVPDAAVGAGAGTGISATKEEEKKARAEVNRCRRNVDSVRSSVSASQRRVSNIESQISSLSSQIQSLTQQQLQQHKKADEIKAGIAILKKAAYFWLLFKQASDHDTDCTAVVQEILSMAAEMENYPLLKSEPTQSITGTFLEAWEEMRTMAGEVR